LPSGPGRRGALSLALATKDIPADDGTVPMTRAPVRPPPVRASKPPATQPMPAVKMPLPVPIAPAPVVPPPLVHAPPPAAMPPPAKSSPEIYVVIGLALLIIGIVAAVLLSTKG